MYTFDDADKGSPNDFIIELSTKQGWNCDTAEELADFLNESVDNGAEVYYMGSFSDDEGGSVLQIRVDQYSVSNPIDRENFRPYIQQGIDAIFGESESNDAERAYGDYVDTAMMDHYDMMNGDIGDFESVEFYKDVKTVCDIAGKPALAEAIIKLHKVYHPFMEAHDNKHRVIPEEIAIAVNNAQAEDYGWRPETTEHAFEGTWDWLEDHADTVLDAWNANNDPREVIRAVEGDEEALACMFDGI